MKDVITDEISWLQNIKWLDNFWVYGAISTELKVFYVVVTKKNLT